MRFSANLGFLFTDRPLAQAIQAAASAGFDAVECHFPYDEAEADVRAALTASGLEMLGLNTWPGDRAAGDFGLCALPDRVEEARAAIDQAIAYAEAIGAKAVHVMAGRTGESAEERRAADDVFRSNLAYACDKAAKVGPELTVLIEPLNLKDVAGYHLTDFSHGAELIAAVGAPNLRLMFDAYHAQIMGGDLTARFTRYRDLIGHVQIAAVPDRGEPGAGEVDLLWLCRWLHEQGWELPVGAEYRPRGATTEGSLAWLTEFQRIGKTSS
ncbi:hydroxypyruvate isomerase family protein [Algihabitans albus]|uniref:hydroxypyruvate isomerase family protein n=1 Tax=Algihabitans albus TaxID=2164067 RepID=UPI000E5C9377|nr:TIM barrel protein [Algihabitans albus]